MNAARAFLIAVLAALAPVAAGSQPRPPADPAPVIERFADDDDHVYGHSLRERPTWWDLFWRWVQENVLAPMVSEKARFFWKYVAPILARRPEVMVRAVEPVTPLGGAARYYGTVDQFAQGYLDDPVSALYIWEGGLSVWGSVAGGAVGAWIAARRIGIPLTVLADALAPGLPVAQAIGRSPSRASP